MDRIHPSKVRSRNVLGPSDAIDPEKKEKFLFYLKLCRRSGATDQEIADELSVPVSLITDYFEDQE